MPKFVYSLQRQGLAASVMVTLFVGMAVHYTDKEDLPDRLPWGSLSIGKL